MTEKYLFHLLVNTPKAHNHRGWSRLKAVFWKLNPGFPRGWVGGRNPITLAASQVHHQETEWEAKVEHDPKKFDTEHEHPRVVSPTAPQHKDQYGNFFCLMESRIKGSNHNILGPPNKS